MKKRRIYSLHPLTQKTILFSALILLGIFFFSCKKEGELTPPFQQKTFENEYSESLKISTAIQKEDSLPTQLLASDMLGILNDPTFGMTTAGFYTQLQLSTSSVNFGNPADLRADSLVLSLNYSGIYGKINEALPIAIHQLTSAFDDSATYYAFDSIPYENKCLGYSVFIPDPYDSVKVNGVTEAPQLRIRLNLQLAQNILQQGSFADNDAFLNFFNGIYVIAESHSASDGTISKTDTLNKNSLPFGNPMPGLNEGTMCNFNLLSAFSGMTIYYTDITTQTHSSYQFEISNTAKRFTVFRHNYQNTTVANCLNDSSYDTLHTYLQGTDGPFVKLYIDNWAQFKAQNEGKIVISKATLTLPIAAGSDANFAPPAKIILVSLDKNGGRNFLEDFYEGESYFGGDYDASTQSYTFNITRHLNNLLSGADTDYGYEILISGRAVDASRVILNSNSNAANPMKIKIVYSKINR